MRLHNGTDAPVEVILQNVERSTFFRARIASGTTAFFSRFDSVELRQTDPVVVAVATHTVAPAATDLEDGEALGGTDPTELTDGDGNLVTKGEVSFVNLSEEDARFRLEALPDQDSDFFSGEERFADAARLELRRDDDGVLILVAGGKAPFAAETG